MSGKRKKGQVRILHEIRDQLILQADRWGRKDYYTPLKLEEMELEQCRKIRGELLAEKANLEYEMSMLGTDKKEVLVKIERLGIYIKKADRVMESHERNILKALQKRIGDKKEIKRAEKSIRSEPLISVVIGA